MQPPPLVSWGEGDGVVQSERRIVNLASLALPSSGSSDVEGNVVNVRLGDGREKTAYEGVVTRVYNIDVVAIGGESDAAAFYVQQTLRRQQLEASRWSPLLPDGLRASGNEALEMRHVAMSSSSTRVAVGGNRKVRALGRYGTGGNAGWQRGLALRSHSVERGGGRA